VNQLFHENTTDSAYATLFFAEYDDRERRVRYANCGLSLASSSSATRLLNGFIPLAQSWGFSKNGIACRGTAAFSGDTLVLYTDGISESFNDAGEEFGEGRLIEVFLRHRDQPSQTLLGVIVAEVRQFSRREQNDDITLIVAKCRETWNGGQES
jgi:serine phosphatase RsbU (regulator of sigma subunit)